ncbi:MAG: hypothetical protein MK212_17320 [Saprospiraceae bacterium]|nr:hypothetical protein [Saprospiraceae bacterium]
MKKRIFPKTLYLLLALLLAWGPTAEAQKRKKCKSVMDCIPNFFVNDNQLPEYLKQVYKRDATRLAIRLLNKEQRLSQQTVDVPEELVQGVYNALIAVRVSDFSAIDSIAEMYNVRTFPVPNVENLILIAEPDAEWLQPLIQRRDSTGSPHINNAIRKNNLALSKMVYLDEERIGLVLQARSPINIPALSMQFFTEIGVGAIEEVLPYGDGNDITIQRTKDGWEVIYSVRFGNCVSQCQKAHNWEFGVSENGEVSYVGSSGHTIPPWIRAGGGAKAKDVLKGR